ncbi:MAG: sigma-70 family RNA polymerase sigma factor [Pirellulaceae bacterium]|nr:sigma-70 family RNA polymerase sigma factor [Pirellulaceae bacterium]
MQQNQSDEITRPQDFEALSRLAANGDVAAQWALLETYASEVRIVARVHLGAQLRPHLDSLDVTQSVHKSILTGLITGRFFIDSSRGLVALACMIARRKIAKKWRKHRRQTRLDTAASPDLVVGLTEQALVKDTVPLNDNRQSPSEVAREQLSLIRDSVTDIERLLIDRKLAGKTAVEIADELKVDPVAVRVRWSRLCAKLRKQNTSDSGAV